MGHSKTDAVASQVASQIGRIIEHLLKLEYSPATGPRRLWLITVRSARSQIRKRLTTAIRADVEALLQDVYVDARRMAVVALLAHGEITAAQMLPDPCPYRLDQILDREWLPANRYGLTDDMP